MVFSSAAFQGNWPISLEPWATFYAAGTQPLLSGQKGERKTPIGKRKTQVFTGSSEVLLGSMHNDISLEPWATFYAAGTQPTQPLLSGQR